MAKRIGAHYARSRTLIRTYVGCMSILMTTERAKSAIQCVNIAMGLEILTAFGAPRDTSPRMVVACLPRYVGRISSSTRSIVTTVIANAGTVRIRAPRVRGPPLTIVSLALMDSGRMAARHASSTARRSPRAALRCGTTLMASQAGEPCVTIGLASTRRTSPAVPSVALATLKPKFCHHLCTVRARARSGSTTSLAMGMNPTLMRAATCRSAATTASTGRISRSSAPARRASRCARL
mmetsp:Transcript_81814/g.198260  ORF Transcript_81814/g.198260 Transcript_81814/m.198260 type:complete len:237 (-) Transcript_81814:4026-4736(-)